MNKPRTVLIVEDETAIRSLLRHTLTLAQFTVQEADSSQAATQQLQQQLPDLILLDWMLPGTDGVQFTRSLKSHPATQHIPIILLTAKAEEDNKVAGLSAGADDYIVKPFSPRELIARIQAVLRRGPLEAPAESIQLGKLMINRQTHTVSIDGDLLKLGRLEYRLLCFFATHSHRVYSRQALLDRVWGHDADIDERTVDVHVRRLRKQLAPYGYDRWIETERGEGYRFVFAEHDDE